MKANASGKTRKKTGDQDKQEFLKRRFIKWGLVCMILFFAGLYALYYIATIPKYSVSDMRKIIADTHKAMAEIPQERRDLAFKLVQFRKTIPEQPIEDAEFKAWYRGVRDRGQLAELHELLRHGPGAFGIDDASLGHLISFRDVGVLLKLDLDWRLKAQSQAEVEKLFQTGRRLAETLEHKGAILGHLMGSMVRHQLLLPVLPHMESVSEDMLRALMRILADSEQTMFEPRDMFNLEPVMMIKDLLKRSSLDGTVPGEWLFHLTRGKIKIISVMMDNHFKCLEAMQGPPHDVIPRLEAINNRIEETTRPCFLNYTNIQYYLNGLSSLLIVPYQNSFCRGVGLHACYRGTRIALALELYRRKAGAYPAALKDLVPAVLPALPDDPFTGRSFCYHRKGRDYLLYSAGGNQIDDHGNASAFQDVRYLPAFGSEDVIIVRPPAGQ